MLALEAESTGLDLPIKLILVPVHWNSVLCEWYYFVKSTRAH